MSSGRLASAPVSPPRPSPYPWGGALSERWTPARWREAQGRLFWAWLLTTPILFIEASSLLFGAPWPGPLRRDLFLLVLASPVVFGVGDRTFRRASSRHRGPEESDGNGGRIGWEAGVAGLAILLWLTAVLALFTGVPNLAAGAALLISAQVTLDWLRLRGRRDRR